MIAGACRLCDRDLAIGVEELVAASRADKDRRVISGAEYLHAHVDLRNVIEPARPELEFEKAFAIGTQRHLVVQAGSHVAEMRRRYVLERSRLEIEDVDGFLRGLDRLHARPGPDHRIRPSRRRFVGKGWQAGCGEQRTCREILQKTAAAFSAYDVAR